MSFRELLISAALVSGAVVFTSPSGAAESVADFYRGKQIRLVIGQPAGGAIDLLTRTVGRHMTKHIPGNPQIIAQNMDGAGSRVAANWLYNVAAKDGTVLGQVSQGTPLDQARKEQGVQFDAAKFHWIGNPLVINGILLSWSASGIKTVDDVRTKGGFICGGSGASSPSVINPMMLKTLTGADIKLIIGYPGNNDRLLAMERGELNCLGGTNLSSTRVLADDRLKDGSLSILVQFGTEKDPEISRVAGRDVPLITEFAKNDTDRRALNLINSGITFGRPIITPPGVPADRVEALRRAFDATVKDPEFLADAARQKIEINPIGGEKLQALAAEVVGADDALIARANEFLTVGDLPTKQ